MVVVSENWFYIIVDIRLGVQYEAENLDINRVFFCLLTGYL